MADEPAPPPVDVWSLTPEQATAKLAEMAAAQRPVPSAEPKTAQEAAARLRVLASDKKWGERYLNGSITERREFAALTELAASGDQAAGVSDGVSVTDALTDPHATSAAAYNGLIDGLREQGLPPSAEEYIRALDAGARTDRPSEGDGLACRQALDRLIKDPGFCQRFLTGEVQANNAVNMLNRIISFAAADGLPVSDTVHRYLVGFGLR